MAFVLISWRRNEACCQWSSKALAASTFYRTCLQGSATSLSCTPASFEMPCHVMGSWVKQLMQGKTWVILAGLSSRNMAKERGRVGLPALAAEQAEIVADSSHGFLSRGCRTWHTFSGCPNCPSTCLIACEQSLLLSLIHSMSIFTRSAPQQAGQL